MLPYVRRPNWKTARQGLPLSTWCTGNGHIHWLVPGCGLDIAIDILKECMSSLLISLQKIWVLKKRWRPRAIILLYSAIVPQMGWHRRADHPSARSRFRSRFLLTRWGGLTSPQTCGCSSSAERLASNQEMAVRFRPAAPPNGFSDFLFGSFPVNMPMA